MAKKYTVEIGQKWFDTDYRMKGRYVYVSRIEGDKAVCQRPNSASMTKLSIKRMEAGTGWRLADANDQ